MTDSVSKPRIEARIVSEKTFRSDSRVNMTDDMVRVTLDMTRNHWRMLKSDPGIYFEMKDD
jgi:hypothetical protein